MNSDFDPMADGDLFQQARWVQGLAFAILRDRQLAEDVSQEVLLKALAGEPRQGRVLKAWLAAVTKNLAFNARRDRQRRSAREERAARPEATPPPKTPLEVLEAHRALTAAIAALAPDAREVVILRFFENLGFAEIAARLEIREEAARMRLHRALAALRAELAARARDWKSLCVLALPASLARSLEPTSALGGSLIMSSINLKLAAGAAVVLLASAGSWFWWADAVEDPAAVVVEFGAPVALEAASTLPELGRAELTLARPKPEAPVFVASSHLHPQPYSGRVYFQGETVAGAEVEIRQGLQTQTVWTDATGMFHALVDHDAHRTIVARTAIAASLHSGVGGWPGRMELLPLDVFAHRVRVTDAGSQAPIPGATVRVFECMVHGRSFCVGESNAASLVVESVTDQNGYLTMAQPLAAGFFAFEVVAPGYITYSGEAVGWDDRTYQLALAAGENPDLFLLDANGAPLTNAQLLVGSPLCRVLEPDADGHVIGMIGWNRPLSAGLPDLIVRLPNGRHWLAHEPAANHPEVIITGARVECRVSDPEVSALLETESVPIGCWVEAARSLREQEGIMLGYGEDTVERIGTSEFLGNPWQRLEPGVTTALERGWSGQGLEVIARLQPQGRLLGRFPIVNGRAIVVMDGLAHLKIAITGLPELGTGHWQAFLRTKAADRFHENYFTAPVDLVDGAAEIWATTGPYELIIEHSDEPVKYFWNGERFKPSSVEQWEMSALLQLAAGETLLEGEAEPTVWRKIRVHLDGHPVHGGQIGTFQLDVEGRIVLPASPEGIVHLPTVLRLFPPPEVGQDLDSPVDVSGWLPAVTDYQLPADAEAHMNFELASFRIEPAGLELSEPLHLWYQPLNEVGEGPYGRIGSYFVDSRHRPDGLGTDAIMVDSANVDWTFRLPAGRYRIWLQKPGSRNNPAVNLTPREGLVFAPGTTTLSKQD